MDACKLRRDTQGRRGGGVTLCVRGFVSCVELKDGDDVAECL